MATILETVTGSSDFDLLERAVLTAGLDGAVAGLAGATVFAPDDAAFTQTAVDLGYAGDPTDEDAVFDYLAGKLTLIGSGDTIGTLQAVLQYHISADFLDSGAVTAADEITVLNGTIGSTAGVADLIDNDPDAADPQLAAIDLIADNGIIHVIDRILLPLDVQTIDDLLDDGTGTDADNSDFDILDIALDVTGLDAVTADPGQEITVFAPTDAAFISLAQSLGFDGADEAGALGYILDVAEVLGAGDPLAVIEDILLYHVVSGALDSTAVIAADGGTLTTALGADIGVEIPSLVDAATDFADPQLILDSLDIYAVNGIVHAIDGVLLPLDIDGDTNISIGSDADDRLKGSKSADLINGKDGSDMIRGKAGDDVIFGGDGADVLRGGRGQDQIAGGAGDDLIWGGRDADTLIFRTGDGDDVVRGLSDDDRILIHSDAFDVTELSGNKWLVSYGETDSILIKGNAHVDIEAQIELMIA